MKKKIPKESGEISRREFLKDAGLVVGGAAIGSTALLAACAPGEVTTETETETVSKFVCPSCSQEFATLALLKDHVEAEHPAELVELPKAKTKIIVYPERCIGCEVCVLACSSYHEGATSRTLSRIRNDIDPLSPDLYEQKVCAQCDNPECIAACLVEEAMYIDEKTGARCVDDKKCTGCGLCVDACPLEPPRISIDQERMVALKCDLCKDRTNGPACAEFCQTQALMLVGVGAEEDIYAE